MNRECKPSRNENYKVGPFVYLIQCLKRYRPSPKYLHWQHWINEVYWNRTEESRQSKWFWSVRNEVLEKTVAHVLDYQILSSFALIFVSFWRQMPVTCISICMRLVTVLSSIHWTNTIIGQCSHFYLGWSYLYLPNCRDQHSHYILSSRHFQMFGMHNW